MKTINKILPCLFAALLLFSCNSKKGSGKVLDTTTSGEISIAADESFSPIIDQQIDVFQNRYPQASITPVYVSEQEAIRMLVDDSVRLVVATRPLYAQEKKTIGQRAMEVREQRLATDGIAIILNKENKDTLISVAQLRKILTGEITEWKQLYPNSKLNKLTFVFDGQGSSSMRFAADSICRGSALQTSNLYAQNSNAEVIEYVARTPGAMGMIGVSWVDNKADTTNMLFTDRVRVMSVSQADLATEANSYKPYQGRLALREYPLTRDVYVISTDPRNGLPTGFMVFMTTEIGQRIIGRAGIVPANMQIFVREVSVY